MASSTNYDGTAKAGSTTQTVQFLDYWDINQNAVMAQSFKQAVAATAFGPVPSWYRPIIVVDCKDLDEQQWHAHRKQGLGGSDIGVLFGTSKWKNNVQLYYEKIGKRPIIEETKSNWFTLEYGKRMEDLVAMLFEEKTGFRTIVDTRMFAHPLYPFLQGNVDRLVQLPDGSIVGLEIKTASTFTIDAWENGACPAPYVLQARLYMAIMDIDVWYVACHYGGNSPDNYVCRRIERDLMIEEDIIAEAESFWNDHVIPQIEPAPIGNPAIALKVQRAFSGYADKSLPMLQLPVALAHEAKSLVAFSNKRKVLKKEMDGIENQEKTVKLPIATAMGAHTSGLIDAGDGKHEYVVNYGPTKGTEVNYDLMENQYPEAYKACVNFLPEKSRSLKVYRRKKR